jgi:NAD(P)-dependent dehydrogenase (short-subunit alcohol dehydrogenase family)
MHFGSAPMHRGGRVDLRRQWVYGWTKELYEGQGWRQTVLMRQHRWLSLPAVEAESGRRSMGALAQSGIRNLEAARRVAAAINETYSHSPALALELDVVESRSVEALVEKVETEVGPIDLWWSNAGIHAGDGLGETTDWRRSLDVNLMGHVNAARAVIPRMVERGNGHFVVTASRPGC